MNRLAVVALRALSLKIAKLQPWILKHDLSNVVHPTGTWRRVGGRRHSVVEGLSDRIRTGTGCQRNRYADVQEDLGFRIFLVLRPHHVLGYGRVGLSPTNSGNVSTTARYDSLKSIMTGADRNQFVLNPT
jgi:hypothetical protein